MCINFPGSVKLFRTLEASSNSWYLPVNREDQEKRFLYATRGHTETGKCHFDLENALVAF